MSYTQRKTPDLDLGVICRYSRDKLDKASIDIFILVPHNYSVPSIVFLLASGHIIIRGLSRNLNLQRFKVLCIKGMKSPMIAPIHGMKGTGCHDDLGGLIKVDNCFIA